MSENIKPLRQNPKISQVTIQPQKGWLSKSLPNLEDLLSTIPLSSLVSEEDELKSQQDFKDIMFEVKSVKVQNQHKEKTTLKCKQCKFNTTSLESLSIHIQNIHEPFIIKKSLNLINGEAGGLSDVESNQHSRSSSFNTYFDLIT